MTEDEFYMTKALELARLSASESEVPVGCVIVFGGNIISSGRNRREIRKNALCHAEIEAIHFACRRLKRWRLSGCTMYVTLEPCPMCAGALINSRIDRLVYASEDPKSGSCGSAVDLFAFGYNHNPAVESGVLREECSSMLSDFFKNLRIEKSIKKIKNKASGV